MKRHHIIGSLLLAAAAALPVAGAPESLADSPRRHGRHTGPAYQPVVVKGDRYFYRGGRFFRSGPKGYVAVRAPLGAVIAGLPAGFRVVVSGGESYFVFGGICYRKVHAGYMVVAPPPGVTVALQAETAAEYGRATVTAARLNVRSGPGLEFGVTAQTHGGESLEVIERRSGWAYVRLPSGQAGWVAEAYIAPPMPPASG